MALNQRAMTLPNPVDGYFLYIHVESETGIMLANPNYGAVYDGTNFLINMSNLTELQGDDIEAALASYVHPVDTTKSLLDVIMQEIPDPDPE